MKRVISMALFVMLVLAAGAQSSIDKLFDKYQGKDGFVTVSINGNLLKFLGNLDDDQDDDFLKHADKFTSIRILAEEDEFDSTENFYDLIIEEVNRGGYEELMTVNSSDADVKMLVKADGKMFREFLLVAGGSSNALIQIKGNLTEDDVKEMSESMKDGKSLHLGGLNY